MKLAAEWTNDCQGKKDYDGEICVVSTRYWPRGGGFSLFDGKEFSTNSDKTIKPSANCTIGIRMPDTDVLSLIEKAFEGETFEEVAAQVESWAQQQYERVVAALKAEFSQSTREGNDG